ncbi:MAG: glycoside hydrolase [Bacteroidetes bacterium]|nr:glycoside hydrolase [Bacteroidota bacterium]
MKKILITTALVCTFAAAFAYFADLNGKWSGTLNAPDGNQYPLNYTFKADGDKLTGSGMSPQGSVDLTQGALKGDSLFFHMDVNGVDVLNSGKYYAAGDSVGLTIDYQGYKMHTTLKRAADTK